MRELNLHTWFINRELQHCPPHFVRTHTIINKNSMMWIKESLVGRFTLIPPVDGEYEFNDYVPAFEDPAEAILYELTWS